MNCKMPCGYIEDLAGNPTVAYDVSYFWLEFLYVFFPMIFLPGFALYLPDFKSCVSQAVSLVSIIYSVFELSNIIGSPFIKIKCFFNK